MAKKHIRSGMIGFCVFVLVVIAGIAVYRAGGTENEMMPPVEQTVTAEEPVSEKETEEHFIARLDGEVLSIYAGSNGREEFLYTLNIRIEDISEEEEMWLREGVVLNGRQALASFEEDFTS